jgi:hypothetical protein
LACFDAKNRFSLVAGVRKLLIPGGARCGIFLANFSNKSFILIAFRKAGWSRFRILPSIFCEKDDLQAVDWAVERR